MPYVSPATQTGGAVIPSSNLNAYKAAADYLSNADRWKVTTVDSTTNSFTTSTPKVVAWELETYDAFGLHGTGAADIQINIAQAGLYEVRSCLSFASNATGFRQVWVAKGASGTTPGTSTTNIVQLDSCSNAGASVVTTCLVEDEVQCAIGDVLWVVGQQSSGGALAVATAAYSNSFSGRWVAIN